MKDAKMKFRPPLPGWKSDAIKTLGYGNLNKVILEFEDVFWDPSVDYFGISPGRSPEETENRGFCTLWWSGFRSSGRALLTGIISGSLATLAEQMSDSEIIEGSLDRLRRVFGPGLPALVKHKVTRWGADPFARGCYTYVPQGATGEHYDILGQPILGLGYGVLFAGEHTVKEHPDTVGGALISGVREGERVLHLLGAKQKIEKKRNGVEERVCIKARVKVDGKVSLDAKLCIPEKSEGEKRCREETLTEVLVLEAERARRLRTF
ncbi:hypothetical protein BSKO_06573 [Bryopsis sp. KO-2023]|nr:hypothetical protein BSKO_06573 [Bryopsis sp. KO-2023]